MTVGVQTSGDTLRLCGVEPDGSVAFTRHHTLDTPFSTDDWATPSRLAETIATHIEDATASICLSLPGGFYHTRRVPMEVAEDVDRRSQVIWEVSQTLSAPPGHHQVDYTVRGSSAIWVAIATATATSVSEAFAACGHECVALCAGPRALGLAISRKHPTGRATGILAESGWITQIDLSDGHISTVATTGPPTPGTSPDLPGHLTRHPNEPADGTPCYIAAASGDLERVADNGRVQTIFPDGLDQGEHVDALTSVAYGAALFTIKEDGL